MFLDLDRGAYQAADRQFKVSVAPYVDVKTILLSTSRLDFSLIFEIRYVSPNDLNEFFVSVIQFPPLWKSWECVPLSVLKSERDSNSGKNSRSFLK
jgi:hypothetical protein